MFSDFVAECRADMLRRYAEVEPDAAGIPQGVAWIRHGVLDQFRVLCRLTPKVHVASVVFNIFCTIYNEVRILYFCFYVK